MLYFHGMAIEDILLIFWGVFSCCAVRFYDLYKGVFVNDQIWMRTTWAVDRFWCKLFQNLQVVTIRYSVYVRQACKRPIRRFVMHFIHEIRGTTSIDRPQCTWWLVQYCSIPLKQIEVGRGGDKYPNIDTLQNFLSPG